jgi:hypothetical protein
MHVPIMSNSGLQDLSYTTQMYVPNKEEWAHKAHTVVCYIYWDQEDQIIIGIVVGRYP